MRYLFTIIAISLFLVNSLLACFCAGAPYCEYFSELVNHEHKFIFKGKYLQELPANNGLVAMQFEVEHVYVGTVVLADSPATVSGTGIENTSSTVWLLTGLDDSFCNEVVSEGSAIFALAYNDDFEINGEPFGYVPTICHNDYFPISEDNIVNLQEWNPWNENEFLPLLDFEQEIVNCAGEGEVSPSTSTNNINANNISIFPNPTTDIATIRSTNNLEDWDITLMETTGKQISKIKSNEVDLRDLNSGVYIVMFTNGAASFVEKIVKI